MTTTDVLNYQEIVIPKTLADSMIRLQELDANIRHEEKHIAGLKQFAKTIKNTLVLYLDKDTTSPEFYGKHVEDLRRINISLHSISTKTNAEIIDAQLRIEQYQKEVDGFRLKFGAMKVATE